MESDRDILRQKLQQKIYAGSASRMTNESKQAKIAEVQQKIQDQMKLEAEKNKLEQERLEKRREKNRLKKARQRAKKRQEEPIES